MLKDMSQRERTALWDLLASVLSARGLAQVNGVIQLEGILGELPGARSWRDPDNYALVVFGRDLLKRHLKRDHK